MTDKEKEAIENIIDTSLKEKSRGVCTLSVEYLKNIKEYIQTQQEEINDLKWRNEIYVKSIKSHKSEIEKKDKIIDEMAIALYDEWYMPSLNTVEKIKEYFIKEVEKENK